MPPAGFVADKHDAPAVRRPSRAAAEPLDPTTRPDSIRRLSPAPVGTTSADRASATPVTTHLPSGEIAPGLPPSLSRIAGDPSVRECSRALPPSRSGLRRRTPATFPSSDSARGRDQSFHVRSAFTCDVAVHQVHVRAKRVVGQERTSVGGDVENADRPHDAMHDALATVARSSWRARADAANVRRGEPDFASIGSPGDDCPGDRRQLRRAPDDGAFAIDDGQPLADRRRTRSCSITANRAPSGDARMELIALSGE